MRIDLHVFFFFFQLFIIFFHGAVLQAQGFSLQPPTAPVHDVRCHMCSEWVPALTELTVNWEDGN